MADLHVGTGQTYSTFDDAFTAASDGDTIILHAGTYTRTSQKSLNKAVNIHGVLGDTVVVTWSSDVAGGLFLWSFSSTSYSISVKNLIVSSSVYTNSTTNAVFLYGTNGNTSYSYDNITFITSGSRKFINMTTGNTTAFSKSLSVTNSNFYSDNKLCNYIRTYTPYNTITNNIFNNGNYGIELLNGATFTKDRNILINRNKFLSNNSDIYIDYSPTYSDINTSYFNISTNESISSTNFVYNNSIGTGVSDANIDFGFINNTVSGTTNFVKNVQNSKVLPKYFTNNICCNGTTIISSSFSITQTTPSFFNNLYSNISNKFVGFTTAGETGDLYVDPLFEDSNFNLRGDSPCICCGITSSLYSNDYFNRIRPLLQSPCIGAVESAPDYNKKIIKNNYNKHIYFGTGSKIINR